MRKILLTIFMGLGLLLASISAMAEADMKNWPDIMTDYVVTEEDNGLVRIDYKRLSETPEDRALLDGYIEELEAADPDSMSDDEAIAYWANLYNALTVQVVVDHYPVKSIKKIKSGVFASGPWKKNLTRVNGKKLSLDDIEHGILRKEYPSPLIHYMVNCASVGCPNLKIGEWKAETLHEDRAAAARDFINSRRGVRVDAKGLVLSSIFKWYDEDFGEDEEDLLNHIRKYADDDLASELDRPIFMYHYDWSLNGVTDE